MLDFGAGVVYEGEPPPEPAPEDTAAIRVWNFLHNGNGAVDWSALGLAVAFFEVDDVEALIGRLLVIKMHKPPEPEKGE